MQRLAEIKGLSEAKIEKMVEAAKKLCPLIYGWQSAREWDSQVFESCFIVSFRPIFLVQQTEFKYDQWICLINDAL